MNEAIAEKESEIQAKNETIDQLEEKLNKRRASLYSNKPGVNHVINLEGKDQHLIVDITTNAHGTQNSAAG